MRWCLLLVSIVAATPGCKKKVAPKADKGSAVASPTLPEAERHNIWLEEFPSCPNGIENMLAHHIKIKVDEGDRVTTGHFVRAPVKTYEGLNLIVKKRVHKVDITFGQCTARGDDPAYRCDDDTQIKWYAKTSLDVDPAIHQTVPFTPPPDLSCVKGETATIVSLVAKRPAGSAGSSGSAGSAAGSAGSAGSAK